MKLTLGFSPCPNDTFIFDALVNGLIDTQGLEFDVVLDDVQTLNQWAIEGKLAITKLSYGVLPLVLQHYALLNSGSALGTGVGPLLIKKQQPTDTNIAQYPIAIPGKNTTAHLLFSLAYPDAHNKIFLRYDEIEPFVTANKGLGVIIHENRFTYQQKGLEKITDLGDYWEQQTQHPIPLGGIVIKRSLDKQLQQTVDGLIKQSIQFAFKRYPQLSDYIRSHAQEMSEAVMRKHINLYVNDYSLALGPKGKAAIVKLMEVYTTTNKLSPIATDIFIA
jgi:1,4-dihydroxy-6-naphthoate synthase